MHTAKRVVWIYLRMCERWTQTCAKWCWYIVVWRTALFLMQNCHISNRDAKKVPESTVVHPAVIKWVYKLFLHPCPWISHTANFAFLWLVMENYSDRQSYVLFNWLKRYTERKMMIYFASNSNGHLCYAFSGTSVDKRQVKDYFISRYPGNFSDLVCTIMHT